ncbi:MAG TPA: MATE family efflux transporter, partial [Dictyoglomaceae bacterium]|nr:MATE family efflux transporter [Dictyoglomaceae bacterium]
MKTVEIDKEEQKKIGSNVLKLAIPVLFENLFQLLFSFVDMIFVGFLGSTALAAVGLGLQVINVILAVVGGLTTGTMVMVAYSIGAKKYKEAEKYLTNSLSLGLFLSVIMLILGISGTDKLLYLLGARGELLSYSSVYLKYILIPGFLIIFMSVISAALRGAGDTRTPLYITMTSNTLNIFLDYILVFGKFGFPKMGVAGAALATSISRLVGVILLFIIIYRRNSVFKFQDFGYSIFTFERDKTSKILNIGFPILVENLLFNIG